MHLSYYIALLVLSTAVSVNTFEPQSRSALSTLTKRTVSPDNSCGGFDGYICPDSQCCSQFGWWYVFTSSSLRPLDWLLTILDSGTTDAYCGNECQPGYGMCGTAPSLTTSISVPSPSSTSSTLQHCLDAKDVPVYFPTTSGFTQLAEPFNLRLIYTPAVVVLPTTIQHISDAMICAGTHNVKVQAKSGGHSYASFSSGGQNGSMIVDLATFQNIEVDPSGVAVIGGGVRLGDMAVSIYNDSQRALPHATWPGIGIGGHATRGGFGPTSRQWGLTLDTILGLDVVIANGTSIHVTADDYPDLWYALRGAADSFGIITTFYLDTVPAPSSIINFEYIIPGLYTPAADMTEAFLHIQAFALNSSIIDGKIGFGVHLDGSAFTISGTYLGDLTTFQNILEPALLSGLPAPDQSTVGGNSWLDLFNLLAAPSSLYHPTQILHDNFYAKSVVVPSSSPLTSAALNNYFAYIISNGSSTQQPTSWFSQIDLYGGPGSAINTPLSTSSAYSDRNALWVVQHYGNMTGTTKPFQPELSFIDGLNAVLTDAMPDTAFGAYLNYVDPELSASEAHEFYYGKGTYSNLLAVKPTGDAGNLFWNPQSVGN